MTTKTTKFDFSDYLTTPDRIAAHLEFAFEQGEAEFAKALGDVARARGMTAVAKSTGLTRGQLYKTLSAEGNPELKTLRAVLKAVGIKTSFGAIQQRRKPVRKAAKAIRKAA